MPSDLQVSNLKDITGSNTGLSIASDGQVSITQNNPTIQLGTNTTFPAGHIVQVVTDSKSHSGSGVSVSGSGNTITTSTGYQLFNTAFTPKYSNSKIIIQTSTFLAFETSNVGDWGWLAAWYDTTNVALVFSTPNNDNWSTGKFASWFSFNHSFNSWGTTEKNIHIRGGTNGAGYVFHQTYSYFPTSPSSSQTVGLTIMEVKQ